MAPGEVITLQVGGFANYVGAHYWNIQDELLGLTEQEDFAASAQQIDQDVLFRHGIDYYGRPTYTPRLVLFDAPGCFGGVSQDQAGSRQPIAATWDGPVSVHAAERIQPSDFRQQLEEEADEVQQGREAETAAAGAALHSAARTLGEPGGVRFWTDFCKVHLHPRSLVEVPSDSAAAGRGFGAGPRPPPAALEDALDAVRRFAEECDGLQGFQCWVDAQGGWGHVARGVLGALRDDFPRTPAAIFPVQPAQEPPGAAAAQGLAPEVARMWRLTEAVALAELGPLAALYSPIAPPWPPPPPRARWDRGSVYETSALNAAALDGATTPWRLGPGALGRADLNAVAQLLARRPAANLAGVFAALPCPAVPSAHSAAAAADGRTAAPERARAVSFSAHETASWTPGLGFQPDALRAEVVALRGARRGGCTLPAAAAAEALEAALDAEGARCVRHCSVSTQPLPIPLPFPQLFTSCVGRYGDIARGPWPLGRAPGAGPTLANGHALAAVASGAAEAAQGRREVELVPLLVRLADTACAGRAIAQQIAALQGITGSSPGRALAASWTYEPEELAELKERLHEIASAYSEEQDLD